MNGRALPALPAALASIQIGAAIVATRFVIEQTSPASLALLHYAIGVCCLLPVALIAGRVRFARHDLVPVALLGVVQFGVLVALLNAGLQTVSAARAALLFGTFPLLTMLFAAVAGAERLTWTTSCGVLLSLCGVGIALWLKAADAGLGHAAVSGELAVLASAVCGALCSVLYRPYLQRYPALAIGAVAMLASTAVLAVLAATEGFFADFPPRFTSAGWMAVVFLGVGSGIGYVLWLWAIGRSTATRVTVFLALSPVTAILLGTLLLGEQLSPVMILGLAAIGSGLWLVGGG